VSPALLETLGLEKSYGATRAAQDVSLAFQAGRVHALVGENGAGKSTVIKMITGLVRPSGGRILWRGEPVSLHAPRAARSLGIVAVQQEMTLVDTLSVARNIWLGHEPLSAIGTVDRRRLALDSERLIASMGLSLDPERLVEGLSIAEKQMVEILKALSLEPSLLVLDEATSTLGDREVELLHAIVRKLQAEGRAIAFVSHRMKEVFRFCDDCSVMKDGRVVFQDEIAQLDERRVIEKMIGRDMSQGFPAKQAIPDAAEDLLRVDHLSTRSGLRDVSFRLRPGEILGIGGLQGHGQVELLECLFGLGSATKGTIEVEGRRLSLRRSSDALRAGIVLVPEDRKTQGLFIDRTVEENLIACSFGDCAPFGFISRRKAGALVARIVERMKVKAPDIKEPVRRLSGGNQQKVALGRWLPSGFKVLLLREPTRGIDVGTKFEIYGLLRELAATGVGIIISTSEIIELVGLSDRVLVMLEKGISAELAPGAISERTILAASFGHSLGESHER
jgi:ABC-type sugar transport system ATPase subunit